MSAASYMVFLRGYANLSDDEEKLMAPIVQDVIDGKLDKTGLIHWQVSGYLDPAFNDVKKPEELAPGEPSVNMLSPLGLALENLYANFDRLYESGVRK